MRFPIINLISVITLLFIESCQTNTEKVESTQKKDPIIGTWSELPPEKSLKDFPNTDFVLTPESPLVKNKNIIYSSIALLSRDKIEKLLNSKMLSNSSNSGEFKLFSKSNRHLNSLDTSDYTCETDIIDDGIILHSFFNKTLPFEMPLQTSNEPLLFKKKSKVAEFGMYFFNEEITKFSQILFYESDNKFILRLTPEDKRHEILLVKGINECSNLEEVLKGVNKLIVKGQNEREQANSSWKYSFGDEDMFSIPKIKFNISTNHEGLEGQNFKTSDNKSHFFVEAYLRNGFILNENGAVIESELTFALDSMVMPPPNSHPKKLILDDTFYIIIKKSTEKNPYFIVKIDNAELLEKFIKGK